VSLALDLGARSNPPALAALCWDSLRQRTARDLSRARFAVLAESFVHTIQRKERSVWFSWLSLSSFSETIVEMERADYLSFYCSTEPLTVIGHPVLAVDWLPVLAVLAARPCR
jgi:hypothetical protein